MVFGFSDVQLTSKRFARALTTTWPRSLDFNCLFNAPAHELRSPLDYLYSIRLASPDVVLLTWLHHFWTRLEQKSDRTLVLNDMGAATEEIRAMVRASLWLKGGSVLFVMPTFGFRERLPSGVRTTPHRSGGPAACHGPQL